MSTCLVSNLCREWVQRDASSTCGWRCRIDIGMRMGYPMTTPFVVCTAGSILTSLMIGLELEAMPSKIAKLVSERGRRTLLPSLPMRFFTSSPGSSASSIATAS